MATSALFVNVNVSSGNLPDGVDVAATSPYHTRYRAGGYHNIFGLDVGIAE